MAEFETVRRAGAGVRTAQIDEGLRAHMNKVYGLMAVAMVITGLAAWAVAGLAVSAEPTAYQIGPDTWLTAFGAAIYTSPLKWVVMLVAARLRLRPLRRRQPACRRRRRSWCSTPSRLAMGAVDQLDLPGLHQHLDRAGVLHHRDRLRRPEPLGLHHEARHLGLGLVPDHGRDRPDRGDARQHLARLAGARRSRSRRSAC